MFKITKDSIQDRNNTEFETNSRFCSCITFRVRDYDSFIKGLYDLMVSLEYVIGSDHFEKPLKLETRIPFNRMIKRFSMQITDIDSLEENYKDIIGFLSDKLKEGPSQDVSERIKRDIKFLEDDLENKIKFLKAPEGVIKIDFRTTETTNENHIKKTFEINPENKILEFIEASSTKEFDFSLCGFLKLKKSKYHFTQGFELGQQTVFSKGIMEILGTPKISGISFNIAESPLGLKKIILGEEGNSITFDLEIEFKSNQISNLSEKITSFFEIINSFFIEV